MMMICDDEKHKIDDKFLSSDKDREEKSLKHNDTN